MPRFGTGSSVTKPRKIYCKQTRCKLSKFIINETLIKVGSDYVWWLWVAIEFESKEILGTSISKERSIMLMLLVQQFLSPVKIHGHQHPVSTDGGTWYRQACR